MELKVDIHLSLPQTLLAELDRIAKARRVRRTHLIREALAEFLKRIEEQRIETEMRTYVDDLSSHSGDFVRETDAHTAKRLLKETEW